MKYRSILTLSAAHAITDINQGAIPVLLPFLISAYGLSYAGAAAIVFATNISSSLVQPLFGHLADRYPNRWLMPAGILFAGLGLALAGAVPTYHLVLGRRCRQRHRHRRLPSRGRPSRKRSFGRQEGDRHEPLCRRRAGRLRHRAPHYNPRCRLFRPDRHAPFIRPSDLRGHCHRRLTQFPLSLSNKPGRSPRSLHHGTVDAVDAWKPFTILTGAVFFRSFAFYGLNTFLPLYFIDVLHKSKMMGGAAMTVFLAAGACGTLAGGRLGDRYGYRPVAIFAFCWADRPLAGIRSHEPGMGRHAYPDPSGLCPFYVDEPPCRPGSEVPADARWPCLRRYAGTFRFHGRHRCAYCRPHCRRLRDAPGLHGHDPLSRDCRLPRPRNARRSSGHPPVPRAIAALGHAHGPSTLNKLVASEVSVFDINVDQCRRQRTASRLFITITVTY